MFQYDIPLFFEEGIKIDEVRFIVNLFCAIVCQPGNTYRIIPVHTFRGMMKTDRLDNGLRYIPHIEKRRTYSGMVIGQRFLFGLQPWDPSFFNKRIDSVPVVSEILENDYGADIVKNTAYIDFVWAAYLKGGADSPAESTAAYGMTDKVPSVEAVIPALDHGQERDLEYDR